MATEGRSVEDAVNNMKNKLENISLPHIVISAHLFSNRERQPALTVDDMQPLTNLISKFPESLDVIWSVNFDDTIPRDLIRFTIIMLVREV